MRGYYDCTTQWVNLLTDTFYGFGFILDGRHGEEEIAEGLFDIYDKLERLPQDELEYEVEHGGRAFLERRIRERYKLPDSPMVYNERFAQVCKDDDGYFYKWENEWYSGTSKPFDTFKQRPDVKGHVDLLQICEEVESLYFAKVEQYRRIMGIDKQEELEQGVFDFTSRDKAPIYEEKGSCFGRCYRDLSAAGAIPPNLTENDFIYLAACADFGQLWKWTETRRGSRGAFSYHIREMARKMGSDYAKDICRSMNIDVQKLQTAANNWLRDKKKSVNLSCKRQVP